MRRWGWLRATGLVFSIVSADLYPCATNSGKSDLGPWTRSREKCSMSWVEQIEATPLEERRDTLEFLDSMSNDDMTAHFHIERGDCPPLTKICGNFETWTAQENNFRRRFVRRAFKHVWDNYEKYAWGYDEMKPLTGQGTDYLGGFGCLILDSLDTLILMGFKDQFFRALEWVRTKLNFHKNKNVSMFESAIRLLGGLLGAYTLYPDPVLLEKAQDIGNRLLLAFRWKSDDHIEWKKAKAWSFSEFGWSGSIKSSGQKVPTPNWGIQSKPPTFRANESLLAMLPFSDVNLGTGERANLGQFSSLAECIVSPEFHALSHFTGERKYQFAADGAVRLLANSSQEAIFYIMRMPENAKVLASINNVVSLGSRGDSFYEYLLKTSIMSGHKLYESLFQSFKKAVHVLMVHADKVTDPLQPTIFAQEIGMVEAGQKKPRIDRKMDHLACFLPGVFALDHMFPNGNRADFSGIMSNMNTSYELTPEEGIPDSVMEADAAAAEEEQEEGKIPNRKEPGSVKDFTPIPFVISWPGGEITLNAVPALWNHDETAVYGNLQFGHDACHIEKVPPANDSTAVLYASRGNCTFQAKARLAMLQGFSTVLVSDYRNSPDRLHTLLPDGESDHTDSAQLFFTDYLEFTGNYWSFHMKLPEEQNMEKASSEITDDKVVLGKELLRTCVGMSFRTQSGLAPEIVRFSNRGLTNDVGAMYNALRPETVESLFYFWRMEKNQLYRNWGWRLMQAWHKHSRTKYGFAHIEDVDQWPFTKKNSMESFFLAETLKYLYLLFSSDDLLSLEEFVLNTEAHPLPSDTRTPIHKNLRKSKFQ